MIVFFLQGDAASQLDVSELINELLPFFDSLSSGDLVYWTLEELYQWADEAVKSLAKDIGIFIVRDDSLTVVPGTAVYELPERHVSTIYLSLANRALLPSSRLEVEARDSQWPDTKGIPQKFIHDGEGMEHVRIYPTPASGVDGQIGVVYHQFPARIQPGSSLLICPKVLREYFTFRILGEALSKESDGAKPEVAEWSRQMADIMKSAAQEYWGDAQ